MSCRRLRGPCAGRSGEVGQQQRDAVGRLLRDDPVAERAAAPPGVRAPARRRTRGPAPSTTRRTRCAAAARRAGRARRERGGQPGGAFPLPDRRLIRPSAHHRRGLPGPGLHGRGGGQAGPGSCGAGSSQRRPASRMAASCHCAAARPGAPAVSARSAARPGWAAVPVPWPGPGCLLRRAGRGDLELGCDVDQVGFVAGRPPDRRVGSRRADPRGHRGAQQAGDLGRRPARAAQKAGRTGSGPGEQEQPLPAVRCGAGRGAGVAGSYATPDRVIPCLGQVCKYTVQAAGTEGSHVLRIDKPGV